MAHPGNQSQDPQIGLRERRRQETRRELADAALELFEKQGLHGTTTDDIASAAGVSPRTFFRYADTKEHAIFVDDDGFDDLLARVTTAIAEGAHPVDAIEEAQRHLLAEFDAEDPERRAQLLRRRRVVIAEPNLLALALATDAQHSQRLLKIVMDADPAASELESRTRVTALGTTLRVTFDEWVRHAENGNDSSVLSLYSEVRQALVAYYAADARGA